MASHFVYWTSDGGGEGGGGVARVLSRWIRTRASPSLIVYGGDVYHHGKASEFDHFRQQVGDLSLMCETAGNHDWYTNHTTSATGKIPTGYEAFWDQHAPPASKQPIDKTKRGGARYEHSILLNGWRLIFLDTGPLRSNLGWPFNDNSRIDWLRQQLDSEPGRSKIICAHHSRLGRGEHGDHRSLRPMWEALFDADGQPRVAFTIAGHDHNVALYRRRGKFNPETPVADPALGIDVIVNGAGGEGHYELDTSDAAGTIQDAGDDENFIVTEIELIDSTHATVRFLSFGTSPSQTIQKEIPNLTLTYDFS